MSSQHHSSDQTPLLSSNGNHLNGSTQKQVKRRGIVNGVLTLAFVVLLVLYMTVWKDSLPKDPKRAALAILDRAPVIDGHKDLPWTVRALYKNNVTAIDLTQDTPGHVDIPRLKKGKVGGFFWSVYTPCRADGPVFTTPINAVRDTLEQIDVAHELINKHSDAFQLATDVRGLQHAISQSKVASMLGVEGGHQLGNSLATLRQYYALGVRYMTLTHSCHNAFADSAGFLVPIPPKYGGLSKLGHVLVREMNRIGMLVDLSHVSDDVMIQVIQISEAPVMFSHSSARSVWNVPRNVPDNVLGMIGTGSAKRDAVVMVNFAPQFVAADGNATLGAVADHIDHIGNVAGRLHVGIGSDYDGIDSTPVGLEDVSKYPDLFAELRRRGWSRRDLAGLAGANFLRVWQGVERTAQQLQKGVQPAYDVYGYRKDL
ncbi:hypothetical protein M422DRAFT_65702 [Sphaerobolus stellatus SS14]|nr:hypothetical protein M422DRAFT_65702 [Sphaerobolus stellatus SS14]